MQPTNIWTIRTDKLKSANTINKFNDSFFYRTCALVVHHTDYLDYFPNTELAKELRLHVTWQILYPMLLHAAILDRKSTRSLIVSSGIYIILLVCLSFRYKQHLRIVSKLDKKDMCLFWIIFNWYNEIIMSFRVFKENLQCGFKLIIPILWSNYHDVNEYST